MRGTKTAILAAICSVSCASVIGADFGQYRVDNSAGATHVGTGGSVPPGSGGTAGQGGRPVAGGAAGTGGAPAGSGGVATCSPRSCASAGTACGVLSDGCTSTIVCECAAGECLQGTCCMRKAACDTGQCGSVSDGCTGTLDCGQCSNACANGVKDGAETATDCGGPSCPSCPLGSACSASTDCLSGSCVANLCATPMACTPTADPTEACDGVDNDCDGTVDNPGACPVNCFGYSLSGTPYMLCKTPRTWFDAQTDCVAHGMNLAVLDSSLENDWGRQTATTAGVSDFWIGANDRAEEGSWRWLGGTRFWIGAATGTPDSGRYSKWATSEPNNTRNEEHCGESRSTGWNDEGCKDTQAYLCERFAVSAGCYDGLRNGTESDVDCGGTCGSCPDASACTVDADCHSQHCLNSFCAALCRDGVKDGNETDVDCGGGTCTDCGTDKMCSVNTDCISGTCTSGKCAACAASACPTCTGIYTVECCKSDETCGCSLPGGALFCQ